MNQALIIIDIQNDYFPGGNMALVGMDDAAGQARRVLDRFRARGLPVFHIQHIANRAGATFFLPDTPGAEIHASVAPHGGEPIIRKHFPNAFRETELDERLREREIEEVVVCGAMTHMCIDTTVRAAFDRGYRCLLVADACATRDLRYGGEVVPARQVQAAFLAALSMPFAEIVDADGLESHLR